MPWDGIEKRRFGRIKYPCKIVVYTSNDHIISTYTENISAGGLRITIVDELALSDIVDLEIYIKEQRPIICKAKVVWVTKRESVCRKGLFYYDIGLYFSEMKEKDKAVIRNVIEAID